MARPPSSAVLAIPNPDRVTDSCFNPDGTLLAFLYVDSSVLVFESDPNRKFTQICDIRQICDCHTTAISMTSSSEVGDLFVVGDELGRTFLYHRTKQEPFTQALTFHQHRGPINAISFAPLSLAFACASSDGTASVTVCDTSTWQIFPVQVSTAPITSVSWSPPRCFSFIDAPNASHEVRFVVGTADGYMSIFQRKGNAVVADQPPIEAHHGAVNCVAWRPLAGFTRDEIATCGTDGMVTLWTFEPDGRIENGAICQCDEEPVDLKWSACGFIISVSSGLTTVSLWRESEHGIWIKIETQD